MTTPETLEIIRNGYSLNDVCVKIYGHANGRSYEKLRKFIEENKLDISHFEKKNKNRKYEIFERECPVCKNNFETTEKLDKTTCSFSCANRYFRSQKSKEVKDKISESLKLFFKQQLKNDNQRALPKQKRVAFQKIAKPSKISHQSIREDKKKILKCIFCNVDFEQQRSEKTCGEKCRKELKSRNSKKSVNELIEKGLHKGWQSRNVESYPEKFFKKVLDNNNIPYEFNKVVRKKDLGVEVNGNYFLDFYLPDCNIDLEIDGKQHLYSDRAESDKLRDSLISKLHTVYRIKWKSLNTENGKKYMKEQIDRFLDFYKSM